MKQLYAALLSLALIVPHQGLAREDLPAIYISEINWAGSEFSQADEWIELYNRTSEEVGIGGWILTGSASKGGAIALPKGTVIKAESALLIANYGIESEKTALEIEPGLVTSALSLTNSDLEVLLTTPEGVVMDSAKMGAERFGGSDPFRTMVRESGIGTTVDGGIWADSDQQINLADGHIGTPGVHEDESVTKTEERDESELPPCTAENHAASEDSTDELNEQDVTEEQEEPDDGDLSNQTEESEMKGAEKLRLSEVMSNPEDGTEWVEIVSEDAFEGDLAGWKLVDAAGKRAELEGSIQSGELMVVELPNQILNNGGDTVTLFSPDGNEVDSTDYSEDPPEKGETWSYSNGSWARSEPTRGEQNRHKVEDLEEAIEPAQDRPKEEQETHTVVAIAHPPETEAPAEAVSESTPPTEKMETKPTKSLSEKTYTGTITSLPGTFGSQIAFMEGYQLYFYHADWPDLSLGDVVSVTGEETVSRNEKRVKIKEQSDLKITGSSEIKPTVIRGIDVGQQLIGTLVMVSGEIIERDGRKLKLDDEGAIVNIEVHDGIEYPLKEMIGESYEITGIIRTLNGSTRLYPQTEQDFAQTIVEQSPSEQGEPTELTLQASTSGGIPKSTVGAGFLAVAGGAALYWAGKHYIKNYQLKLQTN